MSGSAVQTLIVVLLVATAAFYITRRVWRTMAAARARKGDAGCSAGCGCEAPPVKGGSRKQQAGSS